MKFSSLFLPLLLGAHLGPPSRFVFLGDSITDGNTAPLLLQQSLGTSAPVMINAGVAGDTARDMRLRLERDVLPRRPTLVFLSAGINDVLRGVNSIDYGIQVAAISDRLKRDGVPMIFLTPTILGPKHAESERKLGDYIEALHRIASREGYPVAEVHSRMREARERGLLLLEPDQIHLSFEGYRVMVRGLLDALGRREVSIPEALQLRPMQGLIGRWKVRRLPEGDWKDLSLPEAQKTGHWWMDQERQRGFAVELGKVAGAGSRYAAVAQVESPSGQEVFFNTGAELLSLRLNGSFLWKSEGWTGWHAGKERIPARLRAGANTVEIESGASFFLSVTDDNSW